MSESDIFMMGVSLYVQNHLPLLRNEAFTRVTRFYGDGDIRIMMHFLFFLAEDVIVSVIERDTQSFVSRDN